jgi:gas vesicle protein
MDKKETSEADFISAQQNQARAAITQTIADMKHALAEGVDLREWTRQHPWILMGTAAVAGAVAGMLVTPSKDEKLKDFFEAKWEKMKEKFTPDVPPEAAPRAAAATEEKPSMIGSILKETMKAVGPAVMGLVTSMMEKQASRGEDENGHEGNGHHGQADATETKA